MSARSMLAPDVAMALGIASTAMPFARTPEDEAERWLRVLRLHGEAGIVLQALGVSEGPLPASRASPDRESSAFDDEGSEGSALVVADDRDAVALVSEYAADIASRRSAGGVGTQDLLVAVMRIYGAHFDRVLRAHGTDREEVLERLASGHRPTRARDPRS